MPRENSPKKKKDAYLKCAWGKVQLKLHAVAMTVHEAKQYLRFKSSPHCCLLWSAFWRVCGINVEMGRVVLRCIHWLILCASRFHASWNCAPSGVLILATMRYYNTYPNDKHRRVSLIINHSFDLAASGDWVDALYIGATFASQLMRRTALCRDYTVINHSFSSLVMLHIDK